MKAHIPLRKYLVASALALGGTGAMGGGLFLQSRPAQAIPVFDSANYAQNLLTAARMLQQINQQIQSLQNEASMLTNMAKNLSRISFPELTELTNKLRAVDQLMAAAQGIDFRIDTLDSQFKRLFPDNYDAAMRSDERLASARERFDAAKDAYQQSMRIQWAMLPRTPMPSKRWSGKARAPRAHCRRPRRPTSCWHWPPSSSFRSRI